MDRKVFVPVILTTLGIGAAWYLYRRMVPAEEAAAIPGVAPVQPGLTAQYGKFNIFLPFQGIGDLIGAIRGGGTQPEATQLPKAEAPTEVTTGPKLEIPPYTPPAYAIPTAPSVGLYGGMGKYGL